MITVKNLHKRFSSFHVLKGIDMHVDRGEIYGFIGQNGAGKTMTMNILASLSRPTDGHCFVDGKDVSRIRHPGDLHIGYLPEEAKFYPWMSAYETLKYPWKIKTDGLCEGYKIYRQHISRYQYKWI